MTLLNVGLIGAAGSGKTTCTDHLATLHGYRWHALAHSLKVTIAFNVAVQFRMSILERPYSEFYNHVDRIIHGEMGVPDSSGQRENAGNIAYVDPILYNQDLAVRDALLSIEKTHKSKLRGVEQLYGT